MSNSFCSVTWRSSAVQAAGMQIPNFMTFLRNRLSRSTNCNTKPTVRLIDNIRIICFYMISIGIIILRNVIVAVSTENNSIIINLFMECSYSPTFCLLSFSFNFLNLLFQVQKLTITKKWFELRLFNTGDIILYSLKYLFFYDTRKRKTW